LTCLDVPHRSPRQGQLLLSTVGAAGGTTAGAAKGPVTYVFGDSISEVGNNNYFQLSLAKSNCPWYGIDYPNSVATGRFTIGRTIGDYMGKCLPTLFNQVMRHNRVAR
jgi:hypothetical protein